MNQFFNVKSEILDVPYQLVKNAKVEVHKAYNSHGALSAEIVVNDQYAHRFSQTSRVSRNLDMMTTEQLARKLNGGMFFFADGQLLDFRYNDYNGFVHSDDTIKSLMETIGVTNQSTMNLHRLAHDEEPTGLNQTRLSLQRLWNTIEIDTRTAGKGGMFNASLFFNWNPFNTSVTSDLSLLRLICTNGMMAVSSLLSYHVPVVNRWEEHLDIAATQLSNKVDSRVSRRVSQLALTRSTISDVLNLRRHCMTRLMQVSFSNSAQRDRLHHIADALDISHLESVYTTAALSSTKLTERLPSHLSMFDTMNIATEMRTYSNPTKDSTNFSLDKFASDLMFSRKQDHNSLTDYAGIPSRESDAERMFFGV